MFANFRIENLRCNTDIILLGLTAVVPHKLRLRGRNRLHLQESEDRLTEREQDRLDSGHWTTILSVKYKLRDFCAFQNCIGNSNQITFHFQMALNKGALLCYCLLFKIAISIYLLYQYITTGPCDDLEICLLSR